MGMGGGWITCIAIWFLICLFGCFGRFLPLGHHLRHSRQIDWGIPVWRVHRHLPLQLLNKHCLRPRYLVPHLNLVVTEKFLPHRRVSRRCEIVFFDPSADRILKMFRGALFLFSSFFLSFSFFSLFLFFFLWVGCCSSFFALVSLFHLLSSSLIYSISCSSRSRPYGFSSMIWSASLKSVG